MKRPWYCSLSMKGVFHRGSVQVSVMNIGAPGLGGAQSTAEAALASVRLAPSTTTVQLAIDRTKRPRFLDGARPPDPLFAFIVRSIAITSSSSDCRVACRALEKRPCLPARFGAAEPA
jgi:hypothetical protein